MTGQFFNEAIQQTFHTLAGEIVATPPVISDGADSDIAEASCRRPISSYPPTISRKLGLTPLEAMAAACLAW